MEAAPGLEAPPCPLCGGDDFRVVIGEARDRLHRKSGVFQVQACRRCGMVITRPRPTAAALGYFYEGAYSGRGARRAELVQSSVWGRWTTGLSPDCPCKGHSPRSPPTVGRPMPRTFA